MKIHVRRGDLAESPTEAAVAVHFEDETDLIGAAAKLNQLSGGLIADIVSQGDFTGQLYQVMMVYAQGNVAAKRMVCVGLGKRSDFTLERLRGPFRRRRSTSDL